MVKKQGGAAVTKADLVEVIQGLETRLDAKLDSKIDGLRTELKGGLRALDQKISAHDQKFESLDQKIGELGQTVGTLVQKVGNMEDGIRRLQFKSGKTDANMRAMEDRLTARMDAGRAENIGLREAFIGRMETLRRETIIFPKILDEHGAALRGHDDRITALEGRNFPTTPTGPSL